MMVWIGFDFCFVVCVWRVIAAVLGILMSR